jgi:hypothetical protein
MDEWQKFTGERWDKASPVEVFLQENILKNIAGHSTRCHCM